MKLSEAVAKRIKEILRERDISQYKLAKISTIHPGTLNDLFGGAYKTVNMKTIYLIVKALNMTMGEFFTSPIFDDDDIEVD